MARPQIHAVILAGGSGERFWPASRRHWPKPLLEVVDGRSLLDATIARARRFAARGFVWVVCGKEHAGALRRATGLPTSRVLVEPERRNTAMAVAWAAQRIAAENPEAVLVVLPADHRIPDATAFARDIRKAARAAADAEVLVTLGVRPSRPDTGYGYIQLGARVGRSHPGLHRVRRFVEKPDAARARRFLKGGRHLWNAGIFVFAAGTVLEEFEACAPEIHRALAPLRRAPRARGEPLRRAYGRAPSLPIDVAVMERSSRVWTLPVRWHWSDVGTWLSLAEELGVETGRTSVLDGEVLFDDKGGNLVWGKDRAIALLGVEGLAVIDSGDVLLITKLERSPDVRGIVARLKQQGRNEIT